MTMHEAAYALIPGYSDRKAVIAKFGKYRLGVPLFQVVRSRPAAMQAVAIEVERRLIAGEDVPDEIFQPILDADRFDELQAARQSVIQNVVQIHSEASTVYDHETVQPALDYLRGELARVIKSTLTAAGALGSATTAEDVLQSTPEAATAWRALTALASEYSEIRQAQASLVKAVIGDEYTVAWFEQNALVADAIETHPGYVARRLSYTSTGRTTNNSQCINYSDWMGAAKASPAFRENLTPERQMVLIATTTKPWLPDMAQLIHAAQCAHIATGAISTSSVDNMERARAEYYKITGATPSLPIPVSDSQMLVTDAPSLQITDSEARMRQRKNGIDWNSIPVYL